MSDKKQIEQKSEVVTPNADKQDHCSTSAQENCTLEAANEPTFIEYMKTVSANNRIEQMRKHAREATFILGRMALQGQFTVLYAGPNKGKTLVTLSLTAESMAQNKNLEVFHLNLDDTYDGIITKSELGNSHKFTLLTPEELTKPQDDLHMIFNSLIAEGNAGQTVLILDTIKKFVDVMDKKSASEFMTECRRFTTAGGTIIALAHVNKHTNGENMSIPAGTSDILDDCDCAYTIELLEEIKVDNGTARVIEFTNHKSRGPNTKSATYKYTNFDDSDYERMFYSVTQIDGEEADQLRAKNHLKAEREKDQPIIDAILHILKNQGETQQQKIFDELMRLEIASRRDIQRCLKKWSKSIGENGIWELKKGDRNSSIYYLPPLWKTG